MHVFFISNALFQLSPSLLNFFVNWASNVVYIRSSHRRYSVRKGVLRNFAKFTGKHLCQSLWLRCFVVKFVKFLRTPFSQNTPGRLLLLGVAYYIKGSSYLKSYQCDLFFTFIFIFIMINDDDELFLWYGWPTKGV